VSRYRTVPAAGLEAAIRLQVKLQRLVVFAQVRQALDLNITVQRQMDAVHRVRPDTLDRVPKRRAGDLIAAVAVHDKEVAMDDIALVQTWKPRSPWS
jgi:hypothetical protein